MSDEKFTYSYSPAKNSEVDRIASKYISAPKKPDSDLEQLRRLDRKAELPGAFAGIAVGLTGILILTGGVILLLSFSHFAAGAAAGIIGFALAASATPVSKAVTKQSRAKYRDEILALSEKIKNGK
ncbi:hypothetical protein SAMN02910447_01992 [Ruminococcus sp. YE71]|uniref:hypothetical protein n=1 Tax=unclassified Ruminococcus TaxID=2608920 RepID=UPI0008802BC6|nr:MULTISPECIES: hypothetical protein [unclassified Ruminococcus]SDA25882.1 hypothetical protein SAMN02910446_02576 [Ruminococcus sp. YE78]SFW35545.1 hypothetical protein SAMN02910447_01992 [Ruminococcus sp. YE71]